MTACVGSSRLGASGISFETREHRHQASSSRTTPLRCAPTSRSVQPLFNIARPPRNKRQATTAVAAVDQEPFHPAKAAKPTAEQIFDLHHVRELSPSFLLYFPFGTSAVDLSKRSAKMSSKQWFCVQGCYWQAYVWCCGSHC